MTGEEVEVGQWVEFYPAPMEMMIVGVILHKDEADYPGYCFVQTKYALFDDKLVRSFTDGFIIHPSKLRKA